MHNHTGNELELMLAGKKPMAVFYRAVHEDFDETGGQDLHKYVKEEVFEHFIFFIKDKDRGCKIFYSIFTQKNQSWRAEIYKTLKKIMISDVWNENLEYIEGSILGYSYQENMDHLNRIRKFRS